MCKLAFVKFSKKTQNKTRKTTVRTILINSWNMGNIDGAGLYLFDDELEKKILIKGLSLWEVTHKLEELEQIPENVIIHARLSTNHKNYQNTQPLESKNYVLAHNGIVHTFEKKSLELETTNDSEIILKLWEKYGTLADVNQRLGGEFNYILLDKARKKLILNCDDGGFSYFASPYFESGSYDKPKGFRMKQQFGDVYVYQAGGQMKGVLTHNLWEGIGDDILLEKHYLELTLSENMFTSYKKKKYRCFNYTDEMSWDTPEPMVQPEYSLAQKMEGFLFGYYTPKLKFPSFFREKKPEPKKKAAKATAALRQ